MGPIPGPPPMIRNSLILPSYRGHTDWRSRTHQYHHCTHRRSRPQHRGCDGFRAGQWSVSCGMGQNIRSGCGLGSHLTSCVNSFVRLQDWFSAIFNTFLDNENLITLLENISSQKSPLVSFLGKLNLMDYWYKVE